MRTATLVIALAISPLSAKAMTVEEMIPGCEAAAARTRTGIVQTDEAASYCLGAALGVAQIMWFNCSSSGYSPHPSLTAVMPSSNTAAVQAWVNWAWANPARWGDEFTSSFVPVLSETFPCAR